MLFQALPIFEAMNSVQCDLTIEEFHQQMLETRDLRRQIVAQVLSFNNCDESLKDDLKLLAQKLLLNHNGEKVRWSLREQFRC